MASSRANFVVGLTGGIGSGKSSAASRFEANGAHVVDADAISHQLTVPFGPAIASIAQAFPGVVNDGVLDRGRLRETVFANSARRKQLEAILHPMVGDVTRAALTSADAQAAPYVILMVPLLFESATYADRIDCAVLIDLDEAQQVERVSANRDVPTETVLQIIAAQMPRSERLLHTQFILDNSGPRDAMDRQVDVLHAVLVANARHVIAMRHTVSAGGTQ